MNEYLAVLRKYRVYTGRAGLREFWMFSLIDLSIKVGLLVIAMTLRGDLGKMCGLLLIVYCLALLLPMLGVTVRRLQDTNHSGWWVIATMIPLVGVVVGVVVIVFLCLDGTSTENKYGPSLKQSLP